LVVGSITNGPFNFFVSLEMAAIAVLCGIRFVPAAVVGGLILQVVPRLLPHLQDGLAAILHRPIEIRLVWFNLILGALLVLQLIAYPEGLWGHGAHKIGDLLTSLGKRRPVPPRPTRVATT